MNWKFHHRPEKEFPWETYYSPQGPEMGSVYGWCYATFGDPATTRRWYSHGGWIKFVHEKDMTLFLLRWA